MAELPFHLKTIETLPGALDILRFLGESDDHTSDVDTICDLLDLSDRRFSKAIRRLVTKGYVIMDGDMVYRLSEQGEDAVGELAEYDAAEGNVPISERADRYDEDYEEDAAQPASAAAHSVKRRLVLALPTTLTANQTSNVIVGFNPADDANTLSSPADMLLRFSVINGEPNQPKDTPLTLSNEAAQSAFNVVPGAYTQMRIKVEVMQMDNFSGDITNVGGMYVDVDVSNLQTDDGVLTAYGADIEVSP